jgi:hypothetical protein
MVGREKRQATKALLLLPPISCLLPLASNQGVQVMSRIGKRPITIPAKVQVTIDGSHIAVKGPKANFLAHYQLPLMCSRKEKHCW